MKHVPTLTAASDRPAADIIALQPASAVQIDPDPVVRLYSRMPEWEVEAMLCRALEDIAVRLNQLQTVRSTGEFAGIVQPAKRLSSVAAPIGLVEVACAAGHVSSAARQGDPVAVEAVLDRLERAFDAAIVQIWDARLTS